MSTSWGPFVFALSTFKGLPLLFSCPHCGIPFDPFVHFSGYILTLENPTQLNTKSTKKRKRQSKDLSITDSVPFPSGFPDAPAQKRMETKEAFERNREMILENIDYGVLADDPHVDREQLDEIVDLLQETVCSTRSQIRIAGNDYPTEVVRSKMLKLNSEHIRFVMDCLKQNTTRIRNIRQYLLAALFNAPSTMSSYYTALVAHDMATA